MFQLSLFQDSQVLEFNPKRPSERKWPAENDDKLRQMLLDGMSRGQIAKELGVTRNAVCGKVFRMGLARERPVGRQPKPAAPRPRRVLVEGVHPWRQAQKPTTSRVRVIPNPVIGISIADSERVGIVFLELERGQCRWPLYEGDAPRMFCGDPSEDKSSYCPHHTARSFKPVTGLRGKIEARIKFLNIARRAGA